MSDIAVPVAKLVNAKRGNEKAMENPRRDTDFFNRNNFDKSFQTDEQFIDGFQVITVKTEKSLNRHVIFLHGGGYVLRAVRSHIEVLRRRTEKTIFIFSVIRQAEDWHWHFYRWQEMRK